MPRVTVTKTYKLFIAGKFPRTESGRSLPVLDSKGAVLAHVCHASRKDLRDAVEAARSAQPGWAEATGYNRGQVLYRMAEMLEGRREDFAAVLAATQGVTRRDARREVEASIDRLVCFSGWADKFVQVLGGENPVSGPYYNFSTTEPTGVVGVVCPDRPPLLALVSLLSPPLCAGNALVIIAGDEQPIPAALFAEVCATSDLPGGAVNLLTGRRDELVPHLADHREVSAISAAGVTADQRQRLERGAAENVKRVTVVDRSPAQWYDEPLCESPWTIEPFTEIKTIWHPSAM